MPGTSSHIDLDYYNRLGEKIDTQEFLRLFQDESYKILARNKVDGYMVSTVWLGTDHNFDPESNDPILFETMIFPEGDWGELYMKRYSTQKEAFEGHEYAVKNYKELIRS